MEEKQHQEAEPDEASKDHSISSLLVANLTHQIVHARHAAGSTDNAPVDICNSFTLNPKVLIDSVCLAQHSVDHVMAVVDSAPLFEHVVGLRGSGVRCAVGIDVGADIGEEVRTVARLCNC